MIAKGHNYREQNTLIGMLILKYVKRLLTEADKAVNNVIVVCKKGDGS